MKRLIAALGITSLLLISGCDDDASVTPSYQVTVTNVTNNQPLSPLLLVLHGSEYQPVVSGQSASIGLEVLAESGNNTMMMSEAISADATAISGEGLMLPGASEQFEVTSDEMQLSLISMLVNSNDAIATIEGLKLDKIVLGESHTVYAIAYDAGTEGNSEAASDIPGPAGGGEGYNVVRDDVDVVHIHPGILSQADGNPSSTLDESHRFSSPIAKVVIERVQ